jgi:hypothetical protein
MSRESLAALQEAHAFNPAPLRGELHELHVPFDEMTGGHGCEQSLTDALRRGQRVALVGISGSGKSSITQNVLGPLVEGLAPLPITVAIERPEIARTRPSSPGTWCSSWGSGWSTPCPSRPAAAVRSRCRTGRRGGSAGSGSALRSNGFRQRWSWPDQARQLLDLIRSEGLQPVLVLDDTDK